MPPPMKQEVLNRTPMFNIQLILMRVNDKPATRILIGMDGMESYTLGPYDGALDLFDAIKLVGVDLRLDDRHNLSKKFDLGETVKAEEAKRGLYAAAYGGKLGSSLGALSAASMSTATGAALAAAIPSQLKKRTKPSP